MTRVKVCGVGRAADLETAVSAGVDAVGFVVDVSVDTPREIPVDRAADLVGAVPPFVTAVLVTMVDDAAATADLADRVSPDALQVHGASDPDVVERFGDAVDCPVLGAVSPARAPAFDGVADGLVVDSLDESGAGGTGRTHDWERTRALVDEIESPVVLAGGLTPGNVADAVERVDPFGVDVASGVEAAPGRKDPAAVSSFVRSAGGRP